MNTLPIVLPVDPLAGCIPFAGAAPPGEETTLFAGTLAEAIARLVTQMNEPDGESALAAFLTGDRLSAIPVTPGEASGVPESTDTSPSPKDAADDNSPAAEKPAKEERLNWAGIAALLDLSQAASSGRLPVALVREAERAVNGERVEQPQGTVAMAVPAVGKPSSKTTRFGGDEIRPILSLKHGLLAFAATQAAYSPPRSVPATPAEGVPAEGITTGFHEGEQAITQSAYSSKPISGAAGVGKNGSASEVGQADMAPLLSSIGQLSSQVEPHRAEVDAPAVRFVPVHQPHPAPEQGNVDQVDAQRLSSPMAFVMGKNADETRSPRQRVDGQMDVVTQMPAETAAPASTGTEPYRAQMHRQADFGVRSFEPSGMLRSGIAPKMEQKQGATPAEPNIFWRTEVATEGVVWPFRGTREQSGTGAYASGKLTPGTRSVAPSEFAEAYPLIMMAAEAALQDSPPERQGVQARWPVVREATGIANTTSAAISTVTPETGEGLTLTSVGIQPVADRAWLRTASWAGEKDVIPAAVSRYLVERLTQAVRHGEQQCRLELYPKELGRVDAHLSFTEERLSVYLGVETAQAHRAIQQALPELRFALEARGVSVGQCHVGLLGGGTAFGQGFDQPRDQAGIPYLVPPYRGESGDVPSQQVRAITPAKPQGLVDLMV